MRSLRRPAAAALTTALLISLAACGGDDEPAGGEPSVEAGGEPVDVPEEGEEVDPAEFVDNLQAGLESSTTAQIAMTMSGGGMEVEAVGEADYTTTPPEMAMTMTIDAMGGAPMDMRLVDGIMYMNMGPMSNDKFVSFDLNDTENLPPGLSGLGDQMNPLAMFEDMEGAITSVTYAGAEDVDGEELSRYEVALDPAELDSLQGMPTGGQPTEELVYDLYLDDDFRVRQLDMTVDQGQQPFEVTVEMTEWDEPVEIEAPPASEVVDPSQLAG